MISSHRNLRTAVPSASPAKPNACFAVDAVENGAAVAASVIPGTANDATVIRNLICDAMRRCTKSRAELADSISLLSGTAITENQLNKIAAESRSDYRLPAELHRAFCFATGDYRLLTFAAEMVGLHLVDDEALALMELGREYLRGKRAAAAVASLESRLEGVQL